MSGDDGNAVSKNDSVIRAATLTSQQYKTQLGIQSNPPSEEDKEFQQQLKVQAPLGQAVGLGVKQLVHKVVAISARQRRALQALLGRPHRREELDAAAGVSNSPHVVMGIRKRGIDIQCEHVKALDRDGKPCFPGVYSLSDAARVNAIELLERVPA